MIIHCIAVLISSHAMCWLNLFNSHDRMLNIQSERTTESWWVWVMTVRQMRQSTLQVKLHNHLIILTDHPTLWSWQLWVILVSLTWLQSLIHSCFYFKYIIIMLVYLQSAISRHLLFKSFLMSSSLSLFILTLTMNGVSIVLISLTSALSLTSDSLIWLQRKLPRIVATPNIAPYSK